jgi:hypothetical protein
VYHVELRQFPHNLCRFNLDERALQAVVAPWARGQTVDFGERKWNPEQARLTIIEGPQLAPGELTMGRGWRAAQRDGEDVTERVLASAVAAAPVHGSEQPSALGDPFALGMQMAALLGPDAMALLERWRAVAAAEPGLAPSEALARAETAIRAERQNG